MEMKNQAVYRLFLLLLPLLAVVAATVGYEALGAPVWKPEGDASDGSSSLRGTVAAERIVGGYNAQVNAYPWFARLVTRNSAGQLVYGVNCGGALIGQSWILTSSHCIMDPDYPDGAVLRERLHGFQIGFYCYESTNCGQGSKRLVYEADAWFVPPGFTSKLFYLNDIALVRLKEPATSTLYAVPDDGQLYRLLQPNSDKLRPIGVGLDETGEFSTRLQAVDLTLISMDQCEDEWDQEEGVFGNSLMCLSISDGSLTCKGDSGGPVISPRYEWSGGRDIVAGVITAGQAGDCNDRVYPDLIGRVSSFFSFISETVCLGTTVGQIPSWCPTTLLASPPQPPAAATSSSTPPEEEYACPEKKNNKFLTDTSDSDSEEKCKWLKSKKKGNRRKTYCTSDLSNARYRCPKTCGYKC